MSGSPYITVPEIAERWHLSAPVVRQIILSNQLVARKIGRQWLVLPEDLETYERTRLNVQPVRSRRRSA